MKNFILGALFWHICGDFLRTLTKVMALRLVESKKTEEV